MKNLPHEYDFGDLIIHLTHLSLRRRQPFVARALWRPLEGSLPFHRSLSRCCFDLVESSAPEIGRLSQRICLKLTALNSQAHCSFLRSPYLIYRLLVDLHAVDRESRPRVELLVANVALEVLRFLMLDQDLFVVKLPVAVPAGNALLSSRDNFV